MIALENQQIFFEDIKELIDELETFEMEVNRNGNISYNAPQGLHDDCVISLALSNYLLNVVDKKELKFYDAINFI
jgi:hypothetical protein